jgi:hypothetical protein
MSVVEFLQAPKDPSGNVIVDERLVQAAGKCQLLDRILPVLKSRQHKVCVVFMVCCSVTKLKKVVF